MNPYSAYYADYASPMMFIIALAHTFAWTGDVQFIRRHWDTAQRIMEWAPPEAPGERGHAMCFSSSSTAAPPAKACWA